MMYNINDDKSKQQADFSVAFLSNPAIMYLSDGEQFEANDTEEIDMRQLCLFRVDQICFEDKAPRKEALENVLSTMRIDGVNFIFLIAGDEKGVHFYYGVSRNEEAKQADILSITDIGEQVLCPSIQGNFRGSKVNFVNPDEKRAIVTKINQMKYAGVLEGVPGANKDDESFQGVDRLVDVMLGDEFAFLVIAKPLDLSMILELQKSIYLLYSQLVPLSKKSIQNSTSENCGSSTGTTKGVSRSTGRSDSEATTEGTTRTDSNSESKTHQTSYSKGNESGGESKAKGTSSSDASNNSTSKTSGTSQSSSGSESKQESTNKGHSESESTTTEFANKEIQDWIKYLDEVIIPRLDYGKGKGVYATTIAMFTKKKACLSKLQNTAIALYAGEIGNRVPLKAVTMSKSNERAIKNFQLPYGRVRSLSCLNERLAHSAMSQVICSNGYGYIGNWITTNELSVVTGLPQKEVVGLRLKEEVEFGLNARQYDISENYIELGNLVQSGNVLENNSVYLDRSVLDQHIFITGVTGSGKTTTCQKIIHSADMPFLVIEPAKTEYRILKENFPDLLVFTLGKNTIAPLKMNPFVFYPHESITSRVDMIKACIESAFDMEAAIPQIIEAAIYKSYEDYYWDISTNKNKRYPEPFSEGLNVFPTLSDLLRNTEIVVKEQGFDERLKNDYIGSIRARLMGLCVGGKGLMLNTHHSVNFKELLEHRVVLELEEIRSAAEKALIMGFILINLNEAIKAKYLESKSGRFMHLTLVEEAHRLLSKSQPGDDPNKRHGVEMFTDMLAEIRKYGESLIIVDQIPNKLTSEVLKNTNTKIIHRLFAADDKDAIGNTVMLGREQKEFLSNLEAGRAVFFSNDTEKAIQIQIKMSSDTGRKAPADAELIQGAQQFYRQHFRNGYIAGLELFKEMPSEKEYQIVKDIGETDVFSRFAELCRNPTKDESREELRTAIRGILSVLNMSFLVEYLKKYDFSKYQISASDDALNEVLQTFIDREFTCSEQINYKRLFCPLVTNETL